MKTIHDSVDVCDYAIARLQFFRLIFESETFVNATSETECLGGALTLDSIIEDLRQVRVALEIHLVDLSPPISAGGPGVSGAAAPPR